MSMRLAGQPLSYKLDSEPSDDTSMELSMAAILKDNITSLMISNVPFVVHQPDIMRCLEDTGPGRSMPIIGRTSCDLETHLPRLRRVDCRNVAAQEHG